MKRVSTKKVNAHPACAVDNDTDMGHLKQVRLVKRRVRTSATMIGVAISMAPSSILLTKPSDRALATEPIGNEPTLNIVPATTKAALGGSINSVESKALVKLAPGGASSFAVVLPNLWVQPKSAAVPQPTPTMVEHQVQTRRTLRREFSQKNHVDAATIAPAKSLPQHPDDQGEKVLKNPRANELIQKLKASKTVETRSESYKFNCSKITSPAARAAFQQLKMDKAPRVSGEINGDLKAKRRTELLDRLKQKPNRLKDSLAELRFEESNNSSAPATKLAELSSDAAIGVALEQKIAVTEPTVVVPWVAPVYRVKAGDTLSAIAHRHGISLSELVKTNNLTDPDRLDINQRLIIPEFKYSSAVDKSACSSIPYNRAGGSQQESASVPPEPRTGTPPLGAVPYGIGGSISENETDQLSPPTVDETQLAQATAVPYGIGGSISEDETDQLSSPTVDKTQVAQSAVTKPKELQLNPYVHNLRADIQRLQQKYYAQQTVSQDVPVESETAPVVHKPAIQSLESLKGRQVSPQLPPLEGVDTYLPKTASPRSKKYIWPTKGALTSGYGWRWGRMHKGIDIAAPIGTPIVAAAPGVVVKAGWNSGGYGNLVDIQHADGTLTRYAHNKRILVHSGQLVEQGQQISEMGSTGRSTGPHLHFELRPPGKTAVNPMVYLPKK